ncbi:hypothetical protein LTR56_023100 [Elasticomyces elasticus]|nr:hypothetical protein LTR56_023100 [Elasticomyces elasticus]KAK3668984.1 hypothetical protein LTR22_000062 [Elasticomyces elasticus]KAK4907215.1 hypothetical protein LTR49_023726 [Elasticomyces elasticus]KAK5759175.1 hypothetical protein LTS12_010644 [Elasticomyces elasticus]
MVQIAADAFDAEIFIHTARFTAEGRLQWELVVRGNAGATQQLHLINYLDPGHFQALTPVQAGYTFNDTITDAMRDPLIGYDENPQYDENNVLIGTVPDPITAGARLPLDGEGLGEEDDSEDAEHDEEQTYEDDGDNANDIPKSMKDVKTLPRERRSKFPQTPPGLRKLTASQTIIGFSTGKAKLEQLSQVQFGERRVLDYDYFSIGLTADQRAEVERKALQRRQMSKEDPTVDNDDPGLAGSFETPALQFDADDLGAEFTQGAEGGTVRTNFGEQVYTRDDGTYFIRSNTIGKNGKPEWKDIEVAPLDDIHAAHTQPPFCLFGRYSDNRTAQEVAAALASHNVVLADYFVSRGLHRQANHGFPLVPFPQQVLRTWVNDRSAAEMVPVYDSPFVLPEYVQMQVYLDLLAAQANPPVTYFFIRSATGLSAARTWDRIRNRWPTLRIQVVLALRDGFMDNTNIQHIQFLLGGHVASAHNILNDLANAEVNPVGANPAAVELLELLQEEFDARTGGMTWDDACTDVYPRGDDRNGFN